MRVASEAETAKSVQTQPPSGREGDRVSGGRSPRNFRVVQIITLSL